MWSSHCAPRCSRYRVKATKESDVFSFAMIMFQACALEPPFAGQTEQQIVGALNREPFDRKKELKKKRVQRRVANGEAVEDVLDELEEEWLEDNPLEDRRPQLPAIAMTTAPRGVVEMMQRCWGDNPKHRPDLAVVLAELAGALTPGGAVYWHPNPPAAGARRIDVTAEMQGRIEWLMNSTAKPQTHGSGRDSHKMWFDTFKVVSLP